MSILDYEFQGNAARTWLLAVAVALAVWAALTAARRVAARRLGARAPATETGLDDLAAELAGGLRRWFLAAVAVHVGAIVLALPASTRGLLRALVVVTLAAQCGLWGHVVIRHALAKHLARHEGDGGARTTATFAAFAARAALWALLGLLLLDNLGVNISALLAGLGVGGVAVALAVQNVLGDLLASLSIALDRPFVVGDLIVVEDLAGTVEHIGLKTTRVRSLSGELLVFSNGDLLRSRLRNFKQMSERRVVLSFGVLYQTSADRLAAIPAMVREAVEAQAPARFDRAHFKGLGASSLDFEAVYFVLDADYKVHMDVRQEVLLALVRRLEGEGIGFAYPTQTVYLRREDGPEPPLGRAAVRVARSRRGPGRGESPGQRASASIASPASAPASGVSGGGVGQASTETRTDQ